MSAEIDLKFNPKYFHFSKYRPLGIKGRRFWNAFAQGVLYFIPMFGMCVEILHQMYHMSSFGLISFHLSLSVPIVATIVIAILFISAAVMSFINGLEQYEKLKNLFYNENELNHSDYILESLKKVYKAHSIPLPKEYDQPLFDNNHLHAPSWFSHFKMTISLSAHTIFGNLAWASSLSALIGMNLFSTVLVLGPLSPFIFMSLFMIINVGFVVWLHGATESKNELHHHLQERKLVEVRAQILVLRTDINSRKLLDDNQNRNFIRALKDYGLISDDPSTKIAPFDSKENCHVFSRGRNQTHIAHGTETVELPRAQHIGSLYTHAHRAGHAQASQQKDTVIPSPLSSDGEDVAAKHGFT